MNRPPAFQFYPKDWNDIKVQRMNYEAQGIYMRILCFMWNDSKDQCSILNDDNMISHALGISKQRWLKNKKEILFDGDPILKKKRNKLISKRLKMESQKLTEYRQMQSEKGKKSALIRGTTVKPRLNNGSTEKQPKGNSSSSSSSSSLNTKIEEVVLYLNEKSGKNFSPKTKKTITLISSLFDDGYSIDNFIQVIDIKTEDWEEDGKMCKYIRPETLFNKTKFENYLNEKKPKNNFTKITLEALK